MSASTLSSAGTSDSPIHVPRAVTWAWEVVSEQVILWTYVPAEVGTEWTQFSISDRNWGSYPVDDEDQLRLQEAARRYEGLDWREEFEPL